LGASPGATGTSMGQQHLRNILATLDVPALCQPEAFIRVVDGLFDEEGNKEFLKNWMNKYVAWVKKYAG
jgi:chromate reductase